MGGSTKTTTSEQKLDPIIKNWITEQQTMARQVANTPFTPYTGDMVAQLTADELAAAQRMRDIASSGVGRADIAQAAELSRTAAGYGPEQFQQNVQGFMSPYQQQVIDATLATMGRRQAESDAATRAQMARAGAFGNERRGVYEAQLAGERELQQRQQLADLYSQGYGQAAALASALPAQQMAAAQNLAQMGTGAAEFETNLATLLSNVGAQQRGITQAELDAARGEFMRGQEDPYRRLAAMGAGLTGMPGGFIGTTTETQKSSGGLLGGIGQALGIAGSAASLFGNPFKAAPKTGSSSASK